MRFLILSISVLTVAVILALQGPGMSMDQTAEPAGMSQTAVFAGGCFWCTESDFEKVPGVSEAVSGYTGGKEVNPTYEQVSGHATGHVEAVRVTYDPQQVSYAQLVEWFWRHIDPTDAGGQFVDRGAQYRSVIFYADAEQQRTAEASKQKLAASGRFDKPIVTEILPLGPFYPAEDYHQDYYKHNPIRYHWYRSGSGRDRFIEKVWGEELLSFDSLRNAGMEMKPAAGQMGDQAKAGAAEPAQPMEQTMTTKRSYAIPDQSELKNRLTPLQYHVTQEEGTEPPFNNTYWNNHDAGIYVDIVSGEPLFSSTDKFESGTGWPSFSRPLEPANIVEKQDRSFFMVRTEVRSKHADSHLGHVFDDGPPPTGQRYCMNSASLRFIPVADLEKEGYGEYLKLFR